MAGRAKTWIWVLAGIVIVGVLCMIAVAGAGIYFATQHIDTRVASPASARREFDEARARFTGQKPLIELDTHGRFVRANTDRAAPPNAQPPEQLNVLAFDPKDGRIVHVKIPFWLLRLKAGGTTIDFNGNRMDLEDLRLTVEDLERFGPTLIVEHTSSDGDRVLIWSQ